MKHLEDPAYLELMRKVNYYSFIKLIMLSRQNYKSNKRTITMIKIKLNGIMSTQDSFKRKLNNVLTIL